MACDKLHRSAFLTKEQRHLVWQMKLTRLSVLQVLAALPLDGWGRGHSLDLRVSVLLIYHCGRQSQHRRTMILRDMTAPKRQRASCREEKRKKSDVMRDLSVQQTRLPPHLSPPARWSASGLSSGCWPWASTALWTDSSSPLDPTLLRSPPGWCRHSPGWALNRPAPPGVHRRHAQPCWGKIKAHFPE